MPRERSWGERLVKAWHSLRQGGLGALRREITGHLRWKLALNVDLPGVSVIVPDCNGPQDPEPCFRSLLAKEGALPGAGAAVAVR